MRAKTIFALAAIAALVIGMVIPLGAELKTQAQQEYEGWTDVEWTNTADILMGSLTYGYKIKVPTGEVKNWKLWLGVGSVSTPTIHDVLKARNSLEGHASYTLSGKTYEFYMRICKPKHYESVSMTGKALKLELDEIRQVVEKGAYLGNHKEMYVYYADYYKFKSMNVVNKTHMVAHLFDMALGEETVEKTLEQLNQSKIPNELKGMFESSNSPLSAEAVVAQTGAEDYWFIFDGIEMYMVWKQEDQLNVWSCCKATEITFTDPVKKPGTIFKFYYIQKGPVMYKFELLTFDMIYEDFSKIFWDPLLRTFQPIVKIT